MLYLWGKRALSWAFIALVTIVPSGLLHAQTTLPATQPDDPLITLTFPQDAPLVTLITYISERLGINFMYDDAIARLPMNLHTPAPIRQSQLLDVLSNLLQTKNMILEDTDVPGFKRIMPAQQALTTPPVIAGHEGAAHSEMVTRVFTLHTLRAEQVGPLVIPMLTKPAGRAGSIPDRQALVITDYAPNVKRIADFIEVVDAAGEQHAVLAIPILNNDVRELSQTIQSLMQGEASAQGGRPLNMTVVPDDISNQLVLSGPGQSVREMAELIRKLDLPRTVDDALLQADQHRCLRCSRHASSAGGTGRRRSQHGPDYVGRFSRALRSDSSVRSASSLADKAT
jgi:general secretion pathway protein D